MDPKLHKAAMSGDFHFLKSWTEDNNSNFLCQATPKKNTVLHVAAEFNHSKFVQEVTHRCPSLLYQANSKGDTPLHVAATVGCSEIVDFLISHAKTLEEDVEGGQVESHKELLRMVNMDKDTALHCAIRNGHEQSVKLLIEADMELTNLTNSADESPLYLAASRGSINMAELILKASPTASSHVGPNGITALHGAVMRRKHLTEILLERKPNIIREQDKFGWTPLHYAAALGQTELVTQYLKHDRFVAYILDNDGESALHVAAFYGRTKTMEEIIEYCSDACDLTDNKGRTALHAAILGGEEKVVKYILETPVLKCLINEQDKDGNTPLHMSALYKQYRIIYMLAREKKVDIGATNKNNLTAYGILVMNGEKNWKAKKAVYLLENEKGVPALQLFINEGLSKLQQQPVGTRPSSSLNTQRMDNYEEKLDFGRKSRLETSLLIATLVATVTFAAAITMPGGYNSQGLATLSAKPAFKAFVIFDTIAFLFSVAAVTIGLSASISYRLQIRYTPVAAACTVIAMLGMVLAFVSAMHVVLEKIVGLPISASVTVGGLALSYIAVAFVDPGPLIFTFPFIERKRNYLRRLLFHYL
ncbi:hypothetical protein ACJW30_11G150300 [Castanea mollissima]